jgi:hypothetical protein
LKIPRARRPKTRLIEPSLITDHLPQTKEGEIDWQASIRVVHPDGVSLALTVSPWELLELASKHIVCGILTRKQAKEYLSRAVLIASVHAAWRVVRGLRRPVMKSDFISRAHQSKGAKKWVKRHDRAKTGYGGSVIQLPFPREPDADQTHESGTGDARAGRRNLDHLGSVSEPAPKLPKAA